MFDQRHSSTVTVCLAFGLLAAVTLVFNVNGAVAGAPNAAGAAAAAVPAVPVPADADWRKFATKFVPIRGIRQVLSPGAFDRTLQHVLIFPANGQPVDTGLPHGGMDAAGKPRPPIMARLAKDFVWIDFDGDGKPGAEETHRINPDGWSDPFTCDLFYDDGTSGKYAFRLKTVIDGERYAIIRAGARTFDFNGKTVTLLDDDGNAKYSDVGRDAILIDGQPVFVLGKHIQIGDGIFEIIVHASGETVEIRPMAKDVLVGILDPFEKYDPPQRSENLKIHTIVFYGPEGSFACDDTHRAVKLPAGIYDMVFGLFERQNETVYLKKGREDQFHDYAEPQNAAEMGQQNQSDVQHVFRWRRSHDGRAAFHRADVRRIYSR